MNRTANNITLVCYDFTSNKLRRFVDKTLKDFGTRLQYSVFLCRLNSESVERCRNKLIKVLSQCSKEITPGDSLVIFERFHPSSADTILGTRISRQPPDFEVI